MAELQASGTREDGIGHEVFGATEFEAGHIVKALEHNYLANVILLRSGWAHMYAEDGTPNFEPFDEKHHTRLSAIFWKSLLKSAMFFYFPFVLGSLQNFFCVTSFNSGQNLLAVNYAVECSSANAEYMQMVTVSFVIQGVYGFGLPCLLLVRLRQCALLNGQFTNLEENELESTLTRQYGAEWNQVLVQREPLSFLFAFLHPRCYWWLVFTLYRRTSLVLVYLIGQSSNPYHRGHVTF